MLSGMAQLLAPGAETAALVSVVPRDGVPGLPPPQELAAAYARHGLSLAEVRPATPAEVAASQSSWAKRLRAGTARPVTLLRLRRGADRESARPLYAASGVPRGLSAVASAPFGRRATGTANHELEPSDL